jgi:hypothetical protein
MEEEDGELGERQREVEERAKGTGQKAQGKTWRFGYTEGETPPNSLQGAPTLASNYWWVLRSLSKISLRMSSINCF